MESLINLLLLEDNPDDAELLLYELEVAGYQLEWKRVETREDFLEGLSPELDLIIADYSLPQFNASEALKILQETDLDIPFIIVTGTISEEVAVECMKNGATDYLLKDRLSRLGEAVRRALEQAEIRARKREAERNFQIMNRAIASAHDGVVIADTSGCITYVNDALLCFCGLKSYEDIAGQPLIDLWPDENVRQEISDALRNNRHIQGEMNSEVDGTKILQYSVNTIFDENNNPMCMMALFLDITEHHQAVAAKQEAEILRVALQKEKELNDLRSRFTSMIVHDFRNPLSTMEMQLYLLKTKTQDMTEQQRESSFETISSQIHQMNQLMNDVLTLGKMNANNLSLNAQRMDLVSFCRLVLDDLQKNLSDNRSITFASSVDRLRVTFDSALLQRVLTNLLSNALKYSDETAAVSLGINVDGSSVVLSVSDEGIGIPEKDRPMLFEAFHRGKNVGRVKGTGLGLAIVKQAIDLHDGSITFESEMGQGTTFHVRLPIDGPR